MYFIMHCMGVRCLKLNAISGIQCSAALYDSDSRRASVLAYFWQAGCQLSRHRAREREGREQESENKEGIRSAK